jgi:hypothetical protein
MQVYPQDQCFILVCGNETWKIYVVDDTIQLLNSVNDYNTSKKLELEYTANPSITFKKEKIYIGKKLCFSFRNQELSCFFNHKCMHKIVILSEYELHQQLYPGPYKTLRVSTYQTWPDCVWMLRTLETKPCQYEIEFPISEMSNVKQSLLP